MELLGINYGIDCMIQKIGYLEANRAELEAIADGDGNGSQPQAAAPVQTPQAAE